MKRAHQTHSFQVSCKSIDVRLNGANLTVLRMSVLLTFQLCMFTIHLKKKKVGDIVSFIAVVLFSLLNSYCAIASYCLDPVNCQLRLYLYIFIPPFLLD